AAGEAGVDETPCIHPYVAALQPLGAGHCTDEQKHVTDRMSFLTARGALPPTDLLQTFGRVADQLSELAFGVNGHVRQRLDPVEEILRHVVAQRAAAHQEVDVRDVAGEVYHALTGGVAASYHDHVPARTQPYLDGGRPVINTVTFEGAHVGQ